MKKIQPFSNATEFEIWKNSNCYKCIKYECTSNERSKAGCVLAFDIDIASVNDGTISIETAFRIGYKNGIVPNCKKFRDFELFPVKINLEVFNQLNLF